MMSIDIYRLLHLFQGQKHILLTTFRAGLVTQGLFFHSNILLH